MCRPCRVFVRLSIYAINFTRVYALALYDWEPLLEMPIPSNVLRASFNSPLSTTAGSREADSMTSSLLTGRSQHAYLEKICPGRRRQVFRRGSADDGARCRRVWGEHSLSHGWFRPVPPKGGGSTEVATPFVF